MKLWKKIAIFLVVIITFVILSYLFKERINLQKYEAMTDLDKRDSQEDLDNIVNAQNAEFVKLEKAPIPSIGSFSYKNDLKLKDVCIKASCNSAFTGKYINKKMVKHLLVRGCRFMDFEIYNIDDIPYVGFSGDENPTSLDSQNKIALSDILTVINENAFRSPTPNTTDPCFIHLRIKTESNGLYSSIASSIHENIKNRLYEGNVTPFTPLKNLASKVVIIIDKSISPNYDKYPICSSEPCMNLGNYVNTESGTSQFMSYRYSYLMNQNIEPVFADENGTDAKKIQMVLPDVESNMFGMLRNPDTNVLLKDYGVQIICYNFYNQDVELQNYENMFGKLQSAIIPLNEAIKYAKEGN